MASDNAGALSREVRLQHGECLRSSRRRIRSQGFDSGVGDVRVRVKSKQPERAEPALLHLRQLPNSAIEDIGRLCEQNMKIALKLSQRMRVICTCIQQPYQRIRKRLCGVP
jgi:hypothetical protein